MSSRMLANRYELLEKIGDGGMAVVYKAKDKLLNRFVAVKILKPEFSKDAKFLESFQRESQAAASLSHPNIVNVYDVGREGNINFIVMELVVGKPLSDIIENEGSLDIHRSIHIAKQIALALSIAHKNNIIHRDVKPHNIMITENGTAKITDFGIARAVSNSTMVGNTGTIMGSVHYFSPEQARGGYIDAKTDIYSLGIVLYEMLTGTIPFDGDNPVQVALMHMNDEIPLPTSFDPKIPAMLEAVILKACDKYQVNRFKDADEMYQALERVSFSMLGFKSDNVDYGKSNINPSNETYETHEEYPPKGEVMNEYKENSNKKRKKVKVNKLKVLAIVLALLCAIPVSMMILSFVDGFGKDKEVAVPNVVGKTAEEAKTLLEEEGFKVEINDTIISSEFEPGEVTSQDPEAGMVVKKKGTTILLNVCKNKSEGTVPDVTNRLIRDAIYLLELNGFKQGEVKAIESDLPKDTVVRQNPGGNLPAEKGATVDLFISKGVEEPTEAKMPTVLGLTLDKAQEVLTEAGFVVGTTEKENSTAYAENVIMWQQYSPGDMVAKGKAVNLKISLGAPQPVGPKNVSLTIDYSAAKGPVFYLTVIVSDESGFRTIFSGVERFKETGSETITITGQGQGKVQVIFDNDVILNKNVDFNTGAIT